MAKIRRFAFFVLIFILVALAFTLITALAARPSAPRFLSHLDWAYVWRNLLPVLVAQTLVWTLTLRPRTTYAFMAGLCTVYVTINNVKFEHIRVPILASDFKVAGAIIAGRQLMSQYLDAAAVGLAVLAMALFVLGARQLGRETANFSQRRTRTAVRGLGLIVLCMLPVTLNAFHKTFFKFYAREGAQGATWDQAFSARTNGSLYTWLMGSKSLFFEMPRGLGDPSRIIAAYQANPLFASTLPQNTLSAVPPDVVVVLSESFFDLRALGFKIAPDVYAEWDQLAQGAVQTGLMGVDIFGGGTLRTEFTVLTGVSTDDLPEPDPLPFYTFGTKPIYSLARYFKNRGYRTIGFHPYHATFWNRQSAYPNMGFDNFITLPDLKATESGPYKFVSDEAGFAKVEPLLRTPPPDGAPTFLFFVTMENHGPWTIDRGLGNRALPVDSENLGPEASKELRQYEFHVRSSARALSDFIARMRKPGTRPIWLVYFGDHAPGLFETYRAKGLDPQDPKLFQTPYLITTTAPQKARESQPVAPVNLHASYLASDFLRRAELLNGRGEISPFEMNEFVGGQCAKQILLRCNMASDMKMSYLQWAVDRMQVLRN